MNKLIAILIAGTFALGSVAAMAQLPGSDKTPAAPVDQKALKAEKDKAKADAAASKAQPKALPDAKAKQDALKEQTKKASGQ